MQSCKVIWDGIWRALLGAQLLQDNQAAHGPKEGEEEAAAAEFPVLWVCPGVCVQYAPDLQELRKIQWGEQHESSDCFGEWHLLVVCMQTGLDWYGLKFELPADSKEIELVDHFHSQTIQGKPSYWSNLILKTAWYFRWKWCLRTAICVQFHTNWLLKDGVSVTVLSSHWLQEHNVTLLTLSALDGCDHLYTLNIVHIIFVHIVLRRSNAFSRIMDVYIFVALSYWNASVGSAAVFMHHLYALENSCTCSCLMLARWINYKVHCLCVAPS